MSHIFVVQTAMQGTYVAHDGVSGGEVVERQRGAVDGALLADFYGLSNAVVAESVTACTSCTGIDEWRPGENE